MYWITIWCLHDRNTKRRAGSDSEPGFLALLSRQSSRRVKFQDREVKAKKVRFGEGLWRKNVLLYFNLSTIYELNTFQSEEQLNDIYWFLSFAGIEGEYIFEIGLISLNTTFDSFQTQTLFLGVEPFYFRLSHVKYRPRSRLRKSAFEKIKSPQTGQLKWKERPSLPTHISFLTQ